MRELPLAEKLQLDKHGVVKSKPIEQRPLHIYHINVFTGDVSGAGTDANVFIIRAWRKKGKKSLKRVKSLCFVFVLAVTGVHGDSGEIALTKSSLHKNKFERKQEDRFVHEAVDLGELVSVKVVEWQLTKPCCSLRIFLLHALLRSFVCLSCFFLLPPRRSGTTTPAWALPGSWTAWKCTLQPTPRISGCSLATAGCPRPRTTSWFVLHLKRQFFFVWLIFRNQICRELPVLVDPAIARAAAKALEAKAAAAAHQAERLERDAHAPEERHGAETARRKAQKLAGEAALAEKLAAGAGDHNLVPLVPRHSGRLLMSSSAWSFLSFSFFFFLAFFLALKGTL